MKLSSTAPIRYRLQPKCPARHLFEVSVTVEKPDPAGQQFMLPVWIPGSYLIREFARHIVSLRAESNGKKIACEKIDKATWACEKTRAVITIIYEVYAWDLSVRGAHFDDTHAFFNGTSVFLLPLGYENAPCEIELLPPEGAAFKDWRVATSLCQTQALVKPPGHKSARSRSSASVSQRGARKAVSPGRQEFEALNSPQLPPKSFGTYTAANYDELIDHPVEMGTFTHATFDACGVTHHVAITGRHRADMVRFCADLKKICDAQIRLFEPETAKAPMDEYWFLIMAVNDGYGGLEHRASTSLICNRDDLPLRADKKISSGYRRLLGLASHEYFHTWNVKRIKPAAFIPYDLSGENYTRQLWFFEGITSYYDDLMLSRAGLIEPLTYLEIAAENIGRVHAQSGRLKQSVAEASFDAWVKYYRQDENSPNAIVSYYQKGSMVGLALDLTIRKMSGGKKTLDDVMRALWNGHGKTGRGVPEGGIETIAQKLTGMDLKDFFGRAVHGREDIDLVPLFAHVGIDLTWKVPGNAKDEPAPISLGAKVGADSNGDARLTHVLDGGAAQAAGLSAGDIVIAVDGLRVNSGTLEKRLRHFQVDDTIALVVFRRDELREATVRLQAMPAQTCLLTMRDTPIDAKARRNAWLLG